MIAIFDLEGVLTDTDRCRFGSWKEMSREQGLVYDEKMDWQLRGLESEAVLQELLKHARRSYSPAEQLALLARQDDLYDEQLQSMGNDILLPGAAKLIKTLKKQRIRIGAASDNGLPGRMLGYVSVRDQFDVISRKEGLWVQLLDIQEKLNAEPAQCLLITAHAQSAESARALGMGALLCDGAKPIDWQQISDAMTVDAVK